MKKVALLIAVAFMSFPVMANSNAEAPMFGCHEQACQVAEQGASLGADIDDVYEMAYEDCMS